MVVVQVLVRKKRGKRLTSVLVWVEGVGVDKAAEQEVAYAPIGGQEEVM